ncbi:DUF1627 domain-containing protein, partial [Escherichia coli]
WKLKRRGWADNKGSMWWLTNEKSDENDTVTQAPKVTAQMLIEAIERHGPKAADELALMFRITSRRVNSSLAMAISKGCLIRVNQNGKFRYCMPGGNLPAQEAATQEDIKTETVADIVQSLPSFTETRANGLILPSLHMANRELRRAKSHVQKWERVCAALRELNKHRDMVAGICRKSGQ